MIDPRRQSVVGRRRRNSSDVRSDARGNAQRADQRRVGDRWRRNREARILLNRHQRVDRCRVENRIVLVSGEKECFLASVVKRQSQWAAEREARVVFFQRKTRDAAGLVVGGVRIEPVVAEKIEDAAAILIRAATRANVDTPA